jgi:predicted N-formylglutamate amidohydrolase
LNDSVGTSLLLGSAEVPPVHEQNATGRSPFLLSCDHYGRLIPRVLGDLGLPESELTRHIVWDIGIAGVAETLARHLDAHLVAQRYSRLVIDCNRPLTAPDSIATLSGGVQIPGNVDLSAADVAARQAAVFVPYHEALRQLVEQRGSIVFVSVHSFTPVFLTTPRPWHCAVLYNRDSRLALALRDVLRSDRLLRVGENEPYAMRDVSDYTVPVHAEARGLIHVELEIRQDLVADQSGQEAWAQRLARLLPQALESVTQR